MSILNSRVENKLDALHNDAAKDYLRVSKGMIKSIFGPLQPADFKNAYLPISRQQGQELHKIITENNCREIVEFGTSFGISTIYLADAVRKTNGKVTTTELIESKARTAMQNIKDAGLGDFVDVRIGDAMETLNDYSEPIDLLFLDGWKDLYLPIFQQLEPHFHPGTFVYADNTDMPGTESYYQYVSSKSDVYSTKRLHRGKALLSVTL